MESNLGQIFWQFMVFGLILISGFAAFWGAKRYRRWLGRRFEEPPKWGTISSLGVGLTLFVLMAVLFGFVVDQARAF
jgi:hypothetical protein